MVEERASPQTTLVLLLGASRWPRWKGPLGGGESFLNSCRAIKEYFLDAAGFKLPAENLCDLFDHKGDPDALEATIADFLKNRHAALKETGSGAKDLIIYYVGHGGSERGANDYLLTIHNSREESRSVSSLRIVTLARTIKDNAAHLRCFLILDCCFAASAVEAFMSAPLEEATRKIKRVFEEYPNRGTALFCSSSKDSASEAPEGKPYTMFSGGLLKALRNGMPSHLKALSLDQISDLTWSHIYDEYREEGVRPELHQPNQRDGKIIHLQLFPNPGAITSEPQSGELPIPPTQLIGRDDELKKVKERVHQGNKRIVTLHGCSGIGKTHLALQAAAELREEHGYNVRYIPLASINDFELIPAQIALAVGFPEYKSLANLANYLRDKQYLLLLDNFEQVIDAAKYVEQIRAECPQVKFLITSQKILGLGSERSIDLEPLGLSRSQDLFVERAKDADEDFQLDQGCAREVAEICSRAGGLPLIIELIAARVKTSHPKAILDDIKRCGFLELKNKRRDILERHATMEKAIGWSYNLLDEGQKQLFRRLSVFEGGFTIKVAREVAAADYVVEEDVAEGVHALLDNSLLQRHKQSQPEEEYRFSMLEVIRLYGLKQLDLSGELKAMRLRHATFFLKKAEEAEPKLTSRERGPGLWLNKLKAEYRNMQSVLEWCMEQPETCEVGLQLASSLFWYWNLRGQLSEGRQWVEKLLDLTGAHVSTEVRARALYSAGGLAFLQGDYSEACAKLDESIELWRRLDQKGLLKDARRLGYTLIIMGVVKLNQGEVEQARPSLEESVEIFQKAKDEWGDEWGLALSLNDLGRVAAAQYRYDEGQRLYERAFDIWSDMGDRWGLPLTLGCLGELACRRGAYREALGYYNEALKWQRESDKWGRAFLFKGLGEVFYGLKEYGKSAKNYQASLVMHHQLGRQQLIAECLEGIVKLAVELGEPHQAALFFGAAEAIRQRIKISMPSVEGEEFSSFLEETLKPQLGEVEFKKGWAKGKAMKLDQVIKQAVGLVGSWAGAD